METQNNTNDQHQRIAADLLIALIQAGRIKPGGVSSRYEVAIDDTLKAYQALLDGVKSASSRA